jgi:hypothetical protein
MLANGWRSDVAKFGKMMFIGPAPTDELSIEETLERGVARIAEC